MDKKSKQGKLLGKIIFIITGLASTIWFLVRVIPKPSRATYPCMKAASPFMASFVVYLMSITGAAIFFKNFKRKWAKAKYAYAVGLFFVAAILAVFSLTQNEKVVYASENSNVVYRTEQVANSPMGVGYGIDPGRVVWVHNPDATNEWLSNNSGDYWWMDKNTDQDLVQQMMDDGIKSVAKEETVKESWSALFKYHDEKLSRSEVGYSKGDKIFIKVNLTRSYDTGGGTYKSDHRMDTSPQIMLAILKQLIEEAGVDEKDITMGDPFRNFRDNYYDKLDGAYPDVTWLDNKGGNGRTQTTLTKDRLYHTSDGRFSGRIPQAYADAKYFINIACLKVHNVAGISLCAKNHQGSVFNETKRGASIEVNLMHPELHYCYPSSNGYESMGEYRHLVDYMGNKYMGGNTVINIVDGLWPGRQGGEEDAPVKYQMQPFDDDYPSSIFMSQDRVAIEAVGYDFLYSEYSAFGSDHHNINDPMMQAVPDYIEQAAEPSMRALDYDPEGDGSDHTESMGVYEHWNNSRDKKYSRNLGRDKGILLVNIYKGELLTSVSQTENASELSIYPNPVMDKLTISYNLVQSTHVGIQLINLQGRVVLNKDLGTVQGGAGQSSFIMNKSLPGGTYLFRLIDKQNQTPITPATPVVVK